MFTGIIKKVSLIASVTQRGDCLSVQIKKPAGWKLSLGQSVAVDGVCSTVVSKSTSLFEVEYMPETLSKTTVQNFSKGRTVNLEQPLTLGDFVDGGLVLGHVDECIEIKKIEKREATALFELELPKGLLQYVALKGSVTINGVNLTIAKKTKNTFTVALIPYTLEHTNLRTLQKGDQVNIEVDMAARYIVNALKTKKK